MIEHALAGQSYAFFLLLAVVVGTAVSIDSARRSGFRIAPLAGVLAGMAVAGVLGCKLYAVVERGGGLHGLAWELGHGYRYPGGVAAASLALPVLWMLLRPPVSLAGLADLCAPSVGIAVAVMRIGCLIDGCCYGSPSSLPWAIRFPAHSPAWNAHLKAGLIDAHAAWSLPVHPLQVYFGLASLGTALFLLWFRRRRAYEGQLALLFLAIDGGAKLLLELLRYQSQPHLQWMALGMMASGVMGLLSVAGLRARRARELASGRRASGPSGAAPIPPGGGTVPGLMGRGFRP